jgi:hypothetical protein
MLDPEVVEFYNNVRDDSWPKIESYADYLRLPVSIKDECTDLHKFENQKNQICSLDYWLQRTSHVCIYKDLAFVPVQKCAYLYNTTIFTNLGWKKVPLAEVDIQNTKFFGTVIHPLQRRLKGLTQWLVECYRTEDAYPLESNPWITASTPIDWAQLKTDLSARYLKKLIQTVGVGDLHSAPYSTMFGSFLSKINWIPMDQFSDNEVKIIMMKFFKLHGYNIELPLDDRRLHVSSPDQIEVFDRIKSEFYDHPENFYSFYKFYGNDLKFFYNLLDNFDPNWQHL